MQETSPHSILDGHMSNLSETKTRVIISNTNTDKQFA